MGHEWYTGAAEPLDLFFVASMVLMQRLDFSNLVASMYVAMLDIGSVIWVKLSVGHGE